MTVNSDTASTSPDHHPASILDHFADLPDPRREQGRVHRLDEIVFVATCAVLCGAESWEQIADYAHSKIDWLTTFLTLPGGVPSHDTFGRVFGLLDPLAFQRCSYTWMTMLMRRQGVTPVATDPPELRPIAIDGKAQRGSARRTVGRSALHVVSAWAVENRLTLGQVATNAKSNEITAIPELLELLDLKGAVVTIDAMGCQKEIAAAIVGEGGQYVLAVKENQPHLSEDIERTFEEVLDRGEPGVDFNECQTEEVRSGRQETPGQPHLQVLGKSRVAAPKARKSSILATQVLRESGVKDAVALGGRGKVFVPHTQQLNLDYSYPGRSRHHQRSPGPSSPRTEVMSAPSPSRVVMAALSVSSRQDCGAGLCRGGLCRRSAHGLADLQEMIQVRPTSGQPHEHAPRAGNHFGGHLDQSGPPRAGETSSQGIALTPRVEEPLAVRLVDRLRRQFGRQAQLGGRGRGLDHRVTQPHQQVQRGCVQVEPEKVRQEPVVAEAVGLQFGLELFVPVLALAPHRVLVVHRMRKDLTAGAVRDH